MSVDSRTLHPWLCNVDICDENGKVIMEFAAANHFAAGEAAFEVAVKSCSSAIIKFREKGRIVRKAKTGQYDSATGKVELIWRE